MTRLLDDIDGPADLKGLDDTQLAQVAQEVRELIVDTIGEIGGHFGANLGACEIAVAIHSLLDSPRDHEVRHRRPETISRPRDVVPGVPTNE